jgi:hypothetical protein
MSEHIHYVTDDTFEEEVLQSQQPFSSTTGPNGADLAK